MEFNNFSQLVSYIDQLPPQTSKLAVKAAANTPTKDGKKSVVVSYWLWDNRDSDHRIDIMYASSDNHFHPISILGLEKDEVTIPINFAPLPGNPEEAKELENCSDRLWSLVKSTHGKDLVSEEIKAALNEA